MMSGYDGAVGAKPLPAKRYRVVRAGNGWRIEVNGCFTRPVPDRKAANRMARKLQRESDHLHHRHPGGAVQ